MTEDEIEELNEQIAASGGSKYANSFTVIGDPHDMTIVFKTHEVPTSSVTISYKACHRLIELLQEGLDCAKTKDVSAENVPPNPPPEDMGTTLAEDLAENQDLKPFKCGVRWVPRPGIPQRD